MEDDCNIMVTISTNSKQDNVSDCCQGLQFDHIFSWGGESKTRKKLFHAGGLSYFSTFMLFSVGITCFRAQRQKMIQKDI